MMWKNIAIPGLPSKIAQGLANILNQQNLSCADARA